MRSIILQLAVLTVLSLACDGELNRPGVDGSTSEAGTGAEAGINDATKDATPLQDAPADYAVDSHKVDGAPQKGLAAKYPGDKGIDKDPAVVFTENFEEGSVSAVTSRYTDHKNSAGMSLVSGVPAKSSGKASMRMRAGGSGPSATDLYKKLSSGYDELFLRYYVKYSSGVKWHHTGAWIGGYNPALNWPSPKAGSKPAGDDRFSISIEPMGSGSNPGPRLDFYNYWMKMHSHMTNPTGGSAYWGNTLIHKKGFAVKNDAWMCIEIQIKVNPGVSNGKGATLAVWRDDVLVQRFSDTSTTGYWIKDKFCPTTADSPECTNYPPPSGTKMIPLDLQLRKTNSLRLNYFWPQNYITSGPAGDVYYGCDDSSSSRPDSKAAEAGTHETGAADGPAAMDGAKLETGTTPEGGAADGGPSHDCGNPHSDWLLCDDFEGMSKGFSAWFASSGWTEAIGKDNAGRMTSSTQAHRGKYAVYMPAAASASYQGADLIWRACSGANKPGCKPLKGYSRLYLRTYVKLASDHKKVHHFLNIGGGPINDYWAPYGNAGCRPDGKRAMGTTVDFKDNSHETFFYTYYPEMKCDPGSSCAKYADPVKICSGCAAKGMPCASGPECCWGNTFKSAAPVALPLGKWVCFEMTMKANDVGLKNGEMAYWIDGKLAHQEKNMQWRKVSTLQLNKVRLQHYLTTADAKGHSNRVWFDDVVISKSRVGCN